MTFDSEVTATYGEALAQLRDKVSGMTNWSVNEDSSAGATSLTKGDYVVLTSSAPAEDYKFEVDSNGGIIIEHGPTWDSSTSSWSERFQFDPANVEEQFNGNEGNGYDVSPVKTDITNTAPSMSDAGTYWLEYTDGGGFAFYFQREVGDGDDSDFFLGMSQVTKAWDYSSAAANEAQWCLGLGEESTTRLVHMSGSGYVNNGNNHHDPGNNDYVGRGMVNPDNNYSNYPLTNTIISSRSFRNFDGKDAVIGDIDMWVRDESGSETGHKDLIQDGSSNNIYTILTRSGMNLAVRMD